MIFLAVLGGLFLLYSIALIAGRLIIPRNLPTFFPVEAPRRKLPTARLEKE